jgi:SAM-dependent methyltransferase
MIKKCNVCRSNLNAPVYDSSSAQSLTSLCELRPGSTRVWFCPRCGHILGNAIEETDEYYATEYRILLDHEEEDQIYEVNNGEIVYRIDQQIKVLHEKLSLKPGMKILDYGCAKAAMSKRLQSEVRGLEFHFFDVSEMYKGYWEKIAPSENHAIFTTPEEWQNRFDVITSYFSLEHIPDPDASAAHIASMLKDDGVFYAIVPDTFGNWADFVVIDHVNHFTAPSIVYLLQQAGFPVVEVDSHSHRGALVVQARKSGDPTSKLPIAGVQKKAEELADYWSKAASYIDSAQSELDGPYAIYGSGFYGAFIFSHLDRHRDITNFLDQSPFRHGKKLFGVPIVPPAALSTEVNTLFVGLNPEIARGVIESQPDLNRPDLTLVFLDMSI